jgi:hypothetical protein
VVETSNNFGNEKNVVQNINDRSAQAKALAEARGHVYKDLLLRNFTDTQIIEAFGELSVSDEDVAVPGAVAAPVPAPGVSRLLSRLLLPRLLLPRLLLPQR